MIRALIVDDEYYAVKGLQSGVDWDAAGVDEVFEAFHAEMARELLSRQEIDVMICDIEMPEGSGLELMAWVQEQGLAIETVVLTCHSEFAYAQKALQLGGSDYLLKPVIYEDLEEVLRKTIRKVEERRKQEETGELYHKYAELWKGRKPILLERFWQDLFDREIRPSREAVSAALATFDVGPEELGQVAFVLLSVEEWQKPLSEREEEIMEFALRKAAEEVLLEGRAGSVIRDRRGNAFVAVHAGDGNGSALRLIEDCRTYIGACRTYFYCKVSCYVSDTVPIEDARKTYLQLLGAEYRNVSRTSEAVLVSGGQEQADRADGWGAGMLLDAADLIEQRDKDSVMRALDAKLAEERMRALTPEALAAYYHALLQAVYYALQRKGFSAHLLYGGKGATAPDTASRSVARLRQWAGELLDAAYALLAGGESESPAVRQVKAYIAAHLDRDLTREELASHVYLNPAYLSRLFRKETGMVLTDYLLQEKMRRASDLLVGTDRTISEIADSLGYGNFSYFARLFRKVYGQSPHDYRKSIRGA
ncbi:helix-turn-helix domain-containing protein [Cohnella sp. GCM10020058]|uniref:response regulator transcription factor n=1 Tax=Cohnella sp. GCM10020058 TaxID=3317330 RepID=UPI003625283C